MVCGCVTSCVLPLIVALQLIATFVRANILVLFRAAAAEIRGRVAPIGTSRETQTGGATSPRAPESDTMEDMRGSLRLAVLLTIGASALIPAAVFPQSQSGPVRPQPAQSTQQQQAQTQKPPVLIKRVSIVTLPVAVSDSSGRAVLDLTQKQFQVFDEGKPQQIIRFDQGGDPLSIVLVLETSSRVAPLLPAVSKTGIIFTQMVMAGTGEAAVIGYNDQVDLLRPMTTDADRVLDTIQHIKPGLDGARLYDALDRAEALLEAQPPERRRAIVVVGEKNDSGSETKLGQVLRRAQLGNMTIYSISLSTTAAAFRKPEEPKPPLRVGPQGTYPVPPPPGTAQTPDVVDEQMGNVPGAGGGVQFLPLIRWLVEHAANFTGHNSLEIAAQGTGGLHAGTFKDNSIQKAMNAIGNDVHGAYLLAYRPPENAAYGYHNIEVRVTKPHLRIRTRPGYYLAPPAQ